jgi:hypothetical protein
MTSRHKPVVISANKEALEYAVRLADVGEKPKVTLARAHQFEAFISGETPQQSESHATKY